MQPTVAPAMHRPRQTVPQVAKNPRSQKRSGGALNVILIVGAVLAFFGALYLTATTDSSVYVVGGIGTSLALVLIRIFR